MKVEPVFLVMQVVIISIAFVKFQWSKLIKFTQLYVKSSHTHMVGVIFLIEVLC